MAGSAALASILVAGVLGATSLAQERARGGTTDTLARVDSGARGYEVVTGTYTWEPKTHTGWHIHPGEMVGHVTEGQLVLEQESKATTFKAGETFVVPARVLHNCANDSTSTVRAFVTYVVEKGKPITMPRPATGR